MPGQSITLPFSFSRRSRDSAARLPRNVDSFHKWLLIKRVFSNSITAPVTQGTSYGGNPEMTSAIALIRPSAM